MIRRALLLGLTLGACAPDAPAPITWQKDVRPLVEGRCAGCHKENGIGPFPFASSDDVRNMALPVHDVLTQHIMPPWPASDSCQQYEPYGSLTELQRAIVTTWLDHGTPEGDPKDFVPLGGPKAELSRVDLSIPMRQPFTPTVIPDEYRCFVLDWPMTEDSVITGFALAPGQPAMIHHADIFFIHPDSAASFQANDTGNGYDCYTLPVLEGGWIGTFVPGSRGMDFPVDSGLRIAPGSKIFIQTHYNTQNTGPLADLSSLQLSIEPHVHKAGAVEALVDLNWINNQTMTIPAYQKDVMHRYEEDPTQFLSVLAGPGFIDGTAVKVWAGTLHMHAMGSYGKLEIVRADGTHDCVLDIPKWDFHWQLPYSLATPLILNPGDKLAVECHWDNSAENQPIINGVQRTPVDLNWGVKTTDEMCVGGFYLTPL
jgi:hypothetical protein